MIVVNRRAAASGVATAPRTAALLAAALLAAALLAAAFVAAPAPALAEGGPRLSLAQIGLARIGLEPAPAPDAWSAGQQNLAAAAPSARLAQIDRAEQLARDLAPLLAPQAAAAARQVDRGLEADRAPEIVVALRALSKGDLIGPGDVALRRLSASGGRPAAIPPGALIDPAAAIGQEARVSIYAGRPIRSGDVGPQTLVERNQIVGVTYRRGALTLRTEARALDAGGFGERIRVLNLDSRRTIFASITGPAETEAR